MKKLIGLLSIVVACSASQEYGPGQTKKSLALGCLAQRSMFHEDPIQPELKSQDIQSSQSMGGNYVLLRLSQQISQCRSWTDYLIKCSQVARLSEIYSGRVYFIEADEELQDRHKIINEKLIGALQSIAEAKGWCPNLIPKRTENSLMSPVDLLAPCSSPVIAPRATTPLSERSHSDVETFYPSRKVFYTDLDDGNDSDGSYSLGHTFLNPSDRSHGTHQVSSHDSDEEFS